MACVCGSGLLLAGQASLSVLFRFALAATGTTVGLVFRACNSLDEDNPTRRIRTFNRLEKAVFAAFFASQRRRSLYHSNGALLYVFVVLPLTHLVFGFAARIAAFDPGHLIVRNTIDSAAFSATHGKGYHDGRNYAHNDNTDHNRLFPAVFHAEISKLLNNMVINSQ